MSALTARQLASGSLLLVAGGGEGALGSWEHAPDFKAEATCSPLSTGGTIPCAVATIQLESSR